MGFCWLEANLLTTTHEKKSGVLSIMRHFAPRCMGSRTMMMANGLQLVGRMFLCWAHLYQAKPGDLRLNKLQLSRCTGGSATTRPSAAEVSCLHLTRGRARLFWPGHDWKIGKLWETLAKNNKETHSGKHALPGDHSRKHPVKRRWLRRDTILNTIFSETRWGLKT